MPEGWWLSAPEWGASPPPPSQAEQNKIKESQALGNGCSSSGRMVPSSPRSGSIVNIAESFGLAMPAIFFLFVAMCLAQFVEARILGGGNNDNSLLMPLLENQHRHHSDDTFDMYVLSMSYQPEFCRENHEKWDGCHKFSLTWEGQLTIHGLWPQRSSGTWPSTCSNEQFDITLLEDLSDLLAQKWPNIKAPSDSPHHDEFWAHEWSKHGTCSGLSQHKYFETALNLLMPTPSVVKKNYGKTIKRDDLEKGYLGSVLVCTHGYLSEVRVCYEKVKEGGAVGERVLCPESMLKEDSCGDEIKIASFETLASIE